MHIIRKDVALARQCYIIVYKEHYRRNYCILNASIISKFFLLRCQSNPLMVSYVIQQASISQKSWVRA